MAIADANERHAARLRRTTIALALVVSLISLLAFTTWLLDAAGTAFWFSPAPMNPLASLLFLFTAGSLIILLRRPDLVGYAQSVLLMISLCLLYILIDNFYSLPFHIDRLLFSQQAGRILRPGGRQGMSIATTAFLLLISGCLILHSKKVIWGRVIQTVEVFVFLSSLFILITYLYRVPERPVFFFMAPLTALNLIILSIAVLLCRAEQGFIKEFVLGAFARSRAAILLPVAIIFPIALGYVRLYGEWLHLFSTELGVALLIIAFVTISIVATWIVALSYNRRISMAEENQRQAEQLIASKAEMRALNERREIENQLRQYRQNLEIIFNNSQDTFVLLDSDAKLVLFNKPFEKYMQQNLGITYHAGMTLYDVIAPNRKEAVTDILQRVRRGEQVRVVSDSVFDHGRKYYNVVYTPVFNNGILTHITVSSTDITEQKLNDAALAKSEANLRIVMDSTVDNVLMLDPEFRLIVANNNYHRYVKEQFNKDLSIGDEVLSLAPAEQKSAIKSILERARVDKIITFQRETDSNGNKKHWDFTITPVLEQTQFLGYCIVQRDITERIKQQAVVEQYRQNLEIIFKNSADNFVLIDTDSKIVLFNEGFRRFPEEVSGITPKVGMSVYDVLPPDRIEASKEIFQKVRQGQSFDIVAKTMAKGLPRFFSVRYSPVYVDNEVKFISISAFDVTEKKNQERLLEESEQFSRELLDSMNLHIAVVGSEGEIINTNRAWDIFGLRNGATDLSRISIGSNYFSACENAIADGDETAQAALNGMRSVLSKKIEYFEMEYPCDSPSEKRWFQLRVIPFQQERIIVLHYDITHRKQIENELKQDQYFLDKASESAKIGYWTSEPGNKNGKLVWSKEVFKIFGIREEDFRGTNDCFFSRVHPEDRSRVIEISRQALEQDKAYHVDHRIVMPDGSARWVNERAQVIRNEKGEPTLMVGIVQDINDRKIIEQVLREYNERFEILSKATNDAIWDYDIEKGTVTWNHGLQSIFGYDLRKVDHVDQWWSEKIHPADHDRVFRERNAIFEKMSTNWIAEYRYLCADGSYKNVLDRAYVIYIDQKPVRMIGAMQDITEVVQYRQNLEGLIKERTEKLNQSLAKEKDLVDLKSRFISIASHEFRTPLATISLSASYLHRYSRKLTSRQVAEKAVSIDHQVQHMKSMLEDVLFVGKSDEGKINVELSETPIGIFEKLATEALHSCGNTHKLQLSVKTNTKSFISDQKLLRNIIFNLTSNAVKFSPDANKVYLSVNEERNHLVLKFRDEGIGIPSDEIKNLFSSFARASNASRIEGTGLGLLIIHRATELLKGTVEVKSELGKGTEFTIKLPLDGVNLS